MDEVEESSSKIVFKKGTKDRLRPFVTRHLPALRSPEELTIRLVRVMVEGPPQQIAKWDAASAMNKASDWADEVIDLIRDKTDLAGCRCEFRVEAVRDDGTVERDYGMVAQPMTENLSPTAEGIVHLMMRHTSSATTMLLQNQQTVIDSYKNLLSDKEREIGRLTSTIERYQEREEDYHRRELELMDRERAARVADLESEHESRERADDRIDRIVEKMGEVGEAGVVELARAAIEQLDPSALPDLIRDLGPHIATLLKPTPTH